MVKQEKTKETFAFNLFDDEENENPFFNFDEDEEEDEFNFFSDDDEEDEYDDDLASVTNPYLKDPHKGLELIASLLKGSKESHSQMRKVQKLDQLIDEKLLQSISQIHVKNEVELYEKLVQLSDKLFEQNKLKLLKSKTVIGIGGQFSAGKSKFINSLLKSEVLPEDQVPTTSIATYLLNDQSNVQAYTKFNRIVPLSMDAVKALSHEFYDTYQLGFSQFINNLVISIPTFPYESIALLDTPGYSKNDNALIKSISDEQKAHDQLKTVDYLIWLIDVENGVIKQGDIEFIESLHLKNPILVVFNKADKKTEKEVQSVVDNTRKQLQNHAIPLYEVIAYSSQEQREYLKKNNLNTFLKEVNAKSKKQLDIQQEIRNVMNELKKLVETKRKSLIQERNDIGNTIFRSQDVSEITTLTELYSVVLQDLKETDYCAKSLARTEKDINKLLAVLNM